MIYEYKVNKKKNGNQRLEMLNYNQLEKSRYKGVSETANLSQMRLFFSGEGSPEKKYQFFGTEA